MWGKILFGGLGGNKSKDLPAAASRAPSPAPTNASLFQLSFDSPPEGALTPQGIHAERVEVRGRVALRLWGGDLGAPSSGRTGGYSIPLPDSFEAAVSGKRVRVTVFARAAGGSGSADFSLAYSTNDVGNSGWRVLRAGQSFEAKGFEWDVPEMEKGNGDFVGVLPAPGAGVEIAALMVEAIARV